MHELLAIGEVMLDLVLDEVIPGRRLHAPVHVRAGGSPVNAALWASQIGTSAGVVGRVGGDVAGRMLRMALNEAGIRTDLAHDDELPTGISVAMPNGTVVTERGANARLSPERCCCSALGVCPIALGVRARSCRSTRAFALPMARHRRGSRGTSRTIFA